MKDEIKRSLSNTSSSQWAPSDYTDGRKPFDWRTKYEPEARRLIRNETIYLVVVSIIYVVALFCMLYVTGDSASPVNAGGDPPSPGPQSHQCYLGYLCAWIAGAVGGSLFGIKWMYHSVAKGIWNEDRRLWRFLTPHVSGAVSLIMVLLISSGLLQIFEKDLASRHTLVIAFGALVGLFSDKALAKMSETADTLFGASKVSPHNVVRQGARNVDEGDQEVNKQL